jgi:hypothetical protein
MIRVTPGQVFAIPLGPADYAFGKIVDTQRPIHYMAGYSFRSSTLDVDFAKIV